MADVEIPETARILGLAAHPNSGAADRCIGLCETLEVLVVIVIRFNDGNLYGATGLLAKKRDQKLYWENRERNGG